MGAQSTVSILTLAVGVVAVLHFAATSFGDGLYSSFGQQQSSDTANVAVLLQTRQQLVQEIAELRHVVQQLDKVDLSAELVVPKKIGGQSAALSPLSPPSSPPPPQYHLRQPQPIPPAAAIPMVPPAVQQQQQPPPPPQPPVYQQPAAPPAPQRADAASSAASSFLSMIPGMSAATRTPAAATAAVAVPPSSASSSSSSVSPFIFAGEAVPGGLKDFPCALRNFKKAQVTTICEIDCRDAACGYAAKVCKGLVECDFIMVQGGQRGGDLSRAKAVLKKDLTRSTDDSMQQLQLSRWWGSPALSTEVRQRIYIVNSYGGCGSKMMAGWLSQLPGRHKVFVYHLHDRHPPDQLRAMPKPPPPSIRGGGKDFRTGRFPGGAKFKKDTALVSGGGMDDYRVVYIYKDPVESMVSRYGWGHCNHIQGDCGANEGAWPKLDQYAAEQVDRMRLVDHFNAYMHPATADRNYPVVALNYHRLWDNLPAVMAALGLPAGLAKTFPPRTETVRNDMTGAAERNAAHTESTRKGLKQMYKSILEDVAKNPAVLVV